MDKIARAYVRLKALRDNVDDSYQVNEKYVREYHSILEGLEKATKKNLDDFKVPMEELRPREEGGNYVTGTTNYSSDNYVEKGVFFSKLDAVLSYFTMLMNSSDGKPPLGFHPPSTKP